MNYYESELIMPDKNNQIVKEIVENLFASMPVFYRKLFTAMNENLGISHYHFAALGMLSRAGQLPVSEIGKRLWISKPQMTAVIDKLVSLDFVTRQPDEIDRRVINIVITPTGQSALKKGSQTIQNMIAGKLDGLSTEDLQNLASSLKNINQIGSKIE
jgi:DNA-binding MarR family transcriptional regulator